MIASIVAWVWVGLAPLEVLEVGPDELLACPTAQDLLVDVSDAAGDVPGRICRGCQPLLAATGCPEFNQCEGITLADYHTCYRRLLAGVGVDFDREPTRRADVVRVLLHAPFSHAGESPLDLMEAGDLADRLALARAQVEAGELSALSLRVAGHIQFIVVATVPLPAPRFGQGQ